jgi:uncharacterized protein (TIGR02284 family)
MSSVVACGLLNVTSEQGCSDSNLQGGQMENKDIVSKLYDLCQLDIDAIRAYDEAIEKIDIETVAENLRNFRADHQRHVSDLTAQIVKYGGTAPENKPDVKGFVIQGFTSLRSLTGTPGALKAMRGNEVLTNSKYKAAQELDLPVDLRQIIDRNYSDEQRHLAYISQCIDQKIWEQFEQGQGVGVSADKDLNVPVT